MNDDDARASYKRVVQRLTNAGLTWIVKEVEEAAALGVAVEVMPETTEDSAVEVVRRIWPENAQRSASSKRSRRRTATRLRYRTPTPQEQLESLSGAIEAVFLDVDDMVTVIAKELGRPPASIEFAPDLPEQTSELFTRGLPVFKAQDVVLTADQRAAVAALVDQLGRRRAGGR